MSAVMGCIKRERSFRCDKSDGVVSVAVSEGRAWLRGHINPAGPQTHPEPWDFLCFLIKHTVAIKGAEGHGGGCLEAAE